MKNFCHKNKKTGFSLIELAIVILIISIFMSGVMSASISASDSAKINATKNKMEEIYRAMGNYLAANGRLPCPAPITELKGADDYGKDKSVGTGNCLDSGASAVSGLYYSSANQLVYGMVPIQNLQLNDDMAEDDFGSKIGYIVDERFTGFNKNPSATNDFNNAPDSSVITINEVDSETEAATTGAAFVLISYGKNQSGAFEVKSATQNATSSDSNENANDDVTGASFDATFVSIADKSDVFDDILFYKTKKEIILDFDVFNLVHCMPTGTNYQDVYIDNVTTFATWPETKYGQVAVATNACDTSDSEYNGTVVYPTKECGAFGIWKVGAVDSCQ